MTLNNPKLILTFELATPETQNLTNSDIVKNSVSFNEQLLNGLDASSNKISLNLSKDCTAIEKILTYQVDTQAVLMDGTTVLFTGYLSDNYTWKVNTSGEQEFQITIEDVGTKKLGKSFLLSSGPSQAYLNAAVYSGANSVVSQVCSRAGITVASNQPAITTVAQAAIDKNLTCKDLLSQVLKECGYTYYFNSDGQLCLYKIDCTTVSGIPVIDKNSLYAVNKNAITLSKKVRQYKQVNVNFDEYETRTGALVYKDVSGQDEDHPDCNITIKPGEYYPVPLLSVDSINAMLALDTTDVEAGDFVKVTATNNIYEVVILGTPGADYDGTYYSFVLSPISEISYVEATDIDKGKEIIAIQNVAGDVEFQGSLTYEISQRGAKNIAVVLHNSGSTDTTVSKLQATATITAVRSKCILTAGEGSGVEGSENLYSTEAKYIHTKAYAQTYANLIAQYYKYCNYTYQFYSTSNYALGTIVNVVDNLFSGLTVNLLLTARSYNDKSNIYKYTGVAISPFNLSAEIEVEDTILPDSAVQGPPGPAGESPLAVAWTNKVISTASTGYATTQQYSEVQAFNTNSYTITGNDSTVEYMDGDKVYPFLLGRDKVTISRRGRLPSGYQEVEYIQGVSGAVIDTGLYYDENTSIGLTAQGIYQNPASVFYIRMPNSYTYPIMGLIFPAGVEATKPSLFWVGEYSSMTNDECAAKNVYNLNKNYFSVNGVVRKIFTPFPEGTSSTETIKILNSDVGSKLYYFEIYNDNGYVAKYIPCYRTSDDVVGLYDLISGTFLSSTNSAKNYIAGSATSPSTDIVIDGVTTTSGDLLTDIFDSQGFSSPYTELLAELPTFTTSLTLPDDSANDFYYMLLKSTATQADWEAAYWPLEIDKLKVEATDGTYTSRDILSVVESDAALLTYQYAMITSNYPTDNDWSDIRQSGWYVGCSYWMRIKYTWEDGSETYSDPWVDKATNELMMSTATLEISSDKQLYEKDLRSADPESVIFTATSNRYISPVYTWTINGSTYTGETVTISFAKNAAPASISASCVLTSLVGSTTYRATKALALSYIDVTQYSVNYGILTSDPATGIEGDSYVKQVGEDYYPYAHVNGEWTQITNVANYPHETAQCRDVILANGVNVKETSAALYGYFRNLSAQYAQIDYLSTETISLQNGGVIKSDNYAEDQYGAPTTGFYMDYGGTSKFVNSTIVDATVSGSFTSDPLETRDETPGSQITGSWNSTAYYNDGDVYAGIANYTTPGVLTSITTGTHTYGSSAISSVLRITEDTQRTSIKTLAQNTSITSSTSISGTMPVNCTNVTVNGTALVKTLSNLAGTVTRTATTQYSTDGTNWSTLTGSKTLSRTYGSSVYARQVYDSSDVTLGSPSNFTYHSVSEWIGKGAYGNGVFVCLANGYNSYLWRSTDGYNWTKMTVSGNGVGYNYKWITFGNGVFVAAGYASSSASEPRGVLATSSDGAHWTYNYIGGGYVEFGGGEFRTGSETFDSVGLYSSTDGYNWTNIGSISDDLVFPFYGANSWITSNKSRYITYLNGQYIRTSMNKIQVSSDNVNWTTTHEFPKDVYSDHVQTPSIWCRVVYYGGYYFVPTFTDPLIKGGRGGRIQYSTDLYNWTESSVYQSRTRFSQPVAGNGIILFNGGEHGTGSDPVYESYYCYYGTYTDSDFSVVTTGSLAIKYDYTSYPIGANLLGTTANILATKRSDYTSWDTTKTTITSYSLNPTAYYTFNSFNQASFDARDYVLNSTFRVKYTKYDGSSLNLTSYSSGGYKYHLRWNGSNFYVFLNGTQIGTFSSSDYFTTGSQISFTPMSQTDAILVKDVIPKADSTYSIGESGNEFLAAYIDNIYGNLTGNVTGNVTGNADTSSSCTGNANTSSSCTGNSATATKFQSSVTLKISDGSGEDGHTSSGNSLIGNGETVTITLPSKFYGAVFN